jgi:DNA polymerase-1
VVNFLQRLVEKHQPDYLAWIHDAGTSFRHEVFPDYKATREKLSEELQADFDQGLDRIVDLLEAYRVPVVAIDGFEADDVIGTMAREGLEQGLKVVVVSGDKDFQQLVRPGVWLLNPGRGGPAGVEEQWVSVENGSERLGVPPGLVTDYLALVGDSSDNVPGVPGIGEKTARELVDVYGNLEEILAHAGEVAKKRPREALLAHEEEARLSKRLVTIRDDVPVELALDQFRLQRPDVPRLRQLFLELEFSSLLKGLEEAERPAGTVATVERRYRPVGSPEEVLALVREVRARGGFSLAVEASASPSGDVLRSELCGLAVALEPGVAWYLPFRHRKWQAPQGELLAGTAAGQGQAPEGNSLAARALAGGNAQPVVNLPSLSDASMQAFRDVLEDPGVAKTGHNLKYAVLLLRNQGVHLRGLEFDVMLASYVLDPGRREHSASVLALEFLELALPSHETLRGKGRQELAFEDVPTGSACEFVCEHADLYLRLRERLTPQLHETRMDALYRTIELPLVDVLADMEWTGVAIDTEWFRSLKVRFQKERERVEQEIYDAAGERFNINSNPQLRTILFERLSLPVKKKTATGPSTDASVLQELADEGHLLPGLLMEYRELAKLESTYLDTLPSLVLPRDGRLHTSYNQTVAATGRLSSSDPNLQNIPIRRELGRDIRRGFVPAPGSLLIAADYSQVELRLLAHLSGDPAFVHAFTTGADIHRETAAIIFGVPVESVTAEMRARAKTINFATIYGQGAHALSRQLRISGTEARDFIATYFDRFRGVRDYLDSMVVFARDHGYVETIFQRRRYIPELKERNFNIRAFGERVAANAPIQGSAADLIKIAMIRIHHRLRQEGSACRMILQVHDELVLESRADEAEEAMKIVRAEMEGAAQLSVPLVVDIGLGKNWLDAKH